MRYILLLGMAVGVAACTQAPNDAASAYQQRVEAASRAAAAQRDAALAGQQVQTLQTAPQAVSVAPVGVREVAQASTTTPTQTVDASPSNPAPTLVAPNNAGISDEQSFDAVSSRQSIESDAARIAANRQQYTVIQPTDLPTRRASGPNIVQYALQTNNPVGASLYRRNKFKSRNSHLRNCSKFLTADMAQQAFLAAGGPISDRRNLDPDGDGFACQWDPRPFRAGLSN